MEKAAMRLDGLYKTAKLLFYTYLRLRNNFRFHGIENVPDGPVILACNHASYLDPVLVSLAFPRPGRHVRWIAWDALFRVPVLNFLIRRLGAFPIAPGKVDRLAIETAVNILREGGIIGIFPEAGRTPTGEFQKVKPGFAMLAARSRAAVVPVVVRGSFKTWPTHKLLPGPGKIRVQFLPPIYNGRKPLDKEAQAALCSRFEAMQKSWQSHGP